VRTGGDADARDRLIGMSRMTRLVDTIRAVGLVVDERFQWLGATRDFEVGKFGCLEIKSYKRFEKLGKWLDQMLVQMCVSNSQSGGKKK